MSEIAAALPSQACNDREWLDPVFVPFVVDDDAAAGDHPATRPTEGVRRSPMPLETYATSLMLLSLDVNCTSMTAVSVASA